MFRRKEINDERIILERRKHNSEAFGILFFGLLIDVFFRSVIARQDIRDFWDIALLFFGICFFLAIRNVSRGILFFEGKRRALKKVIPSALVAAIAMQATFKWLNPQTSLLDMVIGGTVSFITFGGVVYLMYYLSDRAANRGC